MTYATAGGHACAFALPRNARDRNLNTFSNISQSVELHKRGIQEHIILLKEKSFLPLTTNYVEQSAHQEL
jgi:hypothetical protein